MFSKLKHILIICAAMVNIAAAEPVCEIKDLTISQSGKNTNIEILLSKKPVYQTFTLDNPSRLVLDIFNSGYRSKHFLGQKSDNIKSVRVGKPNSDTTRLVFDIISESGVNINNHYITKYADSNDSILKIQLKNIGKTRYTLADEPKLSGYNPSMIIDILQKPEIEDNRVAPPVKVEESDIEEDIFAGYDKSIVKPKSNIEGRFARMKPARTVSLSQLNKAVGKNKKPVIVIDAGHGGVDPGTMSRSKIKEKHVVLKYAQDLAKLLNKSGNYHVVLTRDKDKYLSLKNRVAIAKKKKANLFISLHADSSPDRSVRGFSIYTLSKERAKKEKGKIISGRENITDKLDIKNVDSDVKNTLIDLVQTNTSNQSSIFAKSLIKYLGKQTRMLRNSHRLAGFKVLTGADIPSVLLEIGYMSNQKDAKLLQTASYRRTVTTNIKKAIDDYFGF